jgi:hypothetical protein
MNVKLDETRCVAIVSDASGFRPYQCQRKRKIDQWCKQHHPDAVAAREEASRVKLETRWRERRERKAAEQEKLRQEGRTQVLKEILEHVEQGGDPAELVEWLQKLLAEHM